MPDRRRRRSSSSGSNEAWPKRQRDEGEAADGGRRRRKPRMWDDSAEGAEQQQQQQQQQQQGQVPYQHPAYAAHPLHPYPMYGAPQDMMHHDHHHHHHPHEQLQGVPLYPGHVPQQMTPSPPPPKAEPEAIGFAAADSDEEVDADVIERASARKKQVADMRFQRGSKDNNVNSRQAVATGYRLADHPEDWTERDRQRFRRELDIGGGAAGGFSEAALAALRGVPPEKPGAPPPAGQPVARQPVAAVPKPSEADTPKAPLPTAVAREVRTGHPAPAKAPAAVEPKKVASTADISARLAMLAKGKHALPFGTAGDTEVPAVQGDADDPFSRFTDEPSSGFAEYARRHGDCIVADC